MASIGITSLMSGTAATDFGGRKATATCMGIVDAFAYLGSSLQSFGIGFLVPDKNTATLALVADFCDSVRADQPAHRDQNLARPARGDPTLHCEN